MLINLKEKQIKIILSWLRQKIAYTLSSEKVKAKYLDIKERLRSSIIDDKHFNGFEEFMSNYQIYGVCDRYDYFGKKWGYVFVACFTNQALTVKWGEHVDIEDLVSNLQGGDMQAYNAYETLKDYEIIGVDKNPMQAYKMMYDKLIEHYFKIIKDGQ